MINSRTYRTYHFQISQRRSEASPSGIKNIRRALRWCKERAWLKYSLHVIIWAGIYAIPFLLHYTFTSRALYSIAGHVIHLLSFSLLITFSYLNYYWLVPEWYAKKAVASYSIIAAIFLAAILGSEYCITTARPGLFTAPASFSTSPAICYNLLLFSISLFGSIVIDLQKGRATAENEILEIKLQLLNTQVKPHFLVHSLQWIYSLALEQPAATAPAVAQLSRLMRHMLNSHADPFIEITKELAYIKDYLAIQEARLANALSLTYSLPLYRGTGRMAPFLFIALIENAFAYGTGGAEDNALNIDISIKGNRLCLQVINNKTQGNCDDVFAGTGCIDVQKRLQLLYPAMHQLEILEDKKIYAVKLIIDIV